MKKSIMFVVIMVLFSLKAYSAQKLIFVFEKFAPFEYTENGQAKGIAVEVIRKVCAEIKVEPVFLELPWTRAIVMVKEGSADGIFSIGYKKERESFIFYPNKPIHREAIIVISKKGKNTNIKSIKELTGRTVNVIQDNFYGDTWESFKGNCKLDFTLSSEQILKKVDAGRGDFAVFNKDVYMHYAKQLGMLDKFKVLFEIQKIDYFVGFSKVKGKEIRDKFNAKLK